MWGNNKFFGITIFATIVFVVISSWLIIHALAVFGIFIAIAYPLWWLFAPNQTFCLLCRAEKEGSRCSFCREQITKKDGISPKNLISAILNGALILIFSIISIGIVYGESQALIYLGFIPTQKTASFILSSTRQHLLGEIFPMNIEIDNVKSPINAIQADIGFDPSKVEVMKISTNNSFANIFIQKTIDNKGGYVRLTGGVPSPGWYGTHGQFGTIYLKALQPGLVTISYLPSSLVLANNGEGTNILKNLPSVSYLILPDKISQDQEKMQQKLLSENVLDASTTTNDQLDFSDEISVLGANNDNLPIKQNSFNVIQFLVNGLGEMDAFILNLASHIIAVF